MSLDESTVREVCERLKLMGFLEYNTDEMVIAVCVDKHFFPDRLSEPSEPWEDVKEQLGL